MERSSREKGNRKNPFSRMRYSGDTRTEIRQASFQKPVMRRENGAHLEAYYSSLKLLGKKDIVLK